MYQQRTIRKSVTWSGIGLHTGKSVEVQLHPAPADHGIVFERSDIPGRPRVKATFDNVVATELASTIGTNGVRVSTVEHLIATIYGMGIDNIVIDVDGDEAPIMDGSAGPLVKQIRLAGIRKLSKPKKFFVVKKQFEIRVGDKFIAAYPANDFSINCSIDYAHPAIGRQNFDIAISAENFEKEISKARTFGFIEDVLMMQSKGLARGGGLHNAVVIDKNGVMNPEGLRYADEFVRHKMLDIIGDLALIGGPIIGRIRAHKTGHDLNNKFVKGLLADPSLIEEVRFDQPDDFSTTDPERHTWQLPAWAD